MNKLVFTASLATALVASVAHAEPPRTRRVAVIVGANAGSPGRPALRYAHADAARVADVLVRAGRFAPSDVVTLLDPEPAAVLAAIDRVALGPADDSMLVFYYSGHSDGQSLFSGGKELPMADVRDRIGKSRARIRVGILDTCRGGSFTRAKGLSVGPPLDAVDLMNVTTEGTALVSSSSGMENAHEADVVKGSFFTHHLTAGLLGAADRSGDGAVTLQEAFEYAKERTVRDSARIAVTAQHPSFDLQLRGRQDVVLTQLDAAPSALAVTQTQSVEVVHLASGVTVVETPPGRQTIRLALPAGRYVVRRVALGVVSSKEIEAPKGGTVALADTQLEVVGRGELAMKGVAEVSESLHGTPRRRVGEIRLAAGAMTGPTESFGTGLYQTSDDVPKLERQFASQFSFTYGLTDRLTWAVPVPAFAYRLGEEGTFEAIPFGGLTGAGVSSISGFVGVAGLGVGTRTWLTPNLRLVSNASAGWQFNTGGPSSSDRFQAQASLGSQWTIADRVTLAFGAGWVGSHLRTDGRDPAASPAPPIVQSTGALTFGAVQSLGFRAIPLIAVHVTPRISIDGHAAWNVDLAGRGVTERYMGGITWSF